MPFKKLGVTLVALSLGLAAAVAVPMSASAHTGTLNVAAVCSADLKTITVTYSGETENVPDSGAGHVATLTVAEIVPSSTTVTPATQQVTGDTTYKFTQVVPADTKSASATADLLWGDNATSDPIGTIDLTGTCDAPTPPTCITAVWKINSGDVNNPWADGGQTLIDHASEPCGTIDTPVPPTTCGTAYQIDSYYDDATTDTLLAGGKLYSAGNPTEHIYNSSYKTVQNDACALPTTAAPAFTFHDVCGTADDTFTPTPADHVVYSAPTDNRVDGVGTITVTATPATGYAFPAGTVVDSTGAVVLSHSFTNEACAVTPPATPPVNTPPAVSPPVVTPPAVTPPKVDAPKVTKPASTITKVSPPKVTTPKVSAPSVSSTPTTPTELASTGIGDSTYISALVALAAVILGAAVLGITVRRRRHAEAK